MVNVSLPGRQHRTINAALRITPSMTEPIIFRFGNEDGLPITLVPFSIRFVVWASSTVGKNEMGVNDSDIIVNDLVEITDPYAGEVMITLSEEETTRIAFAGPGMTVKWSLFMINDDDEVFPVQVGPNGVRYGSIEIDLAGGVPFANKIINPIE